MGKREFAVVDTHCHIGLHKYEPVEVLLFHMARAGVDQAVLIQYMGNSDNRYIVEVMEANPGRLAAAMIVDDDDDGTAIRGWAEQGIAGIRLLADFRGRGGDPLAHWRVADELGLVVSVFSRPDILQSAEFNEVLRLFPSRTNKERCNACFGSINDPQQNLCNLCLDCFGIMRNSLIDTAIGHRLYNLRVMQPVTTPPLWISKRKTAAPHVLTPLTKTDGHPKLCNPWYAVFKDDEDFLRRYRTNHLKGNAPLC